MVLRAVDIGFNWWRVAGPWLSGLVWCAWFLLGGAACPGELVLGEQVLGEQVLG